MKKILLLVLTLTNRRKQETAFCHPPEYIVMKDI